ncbi:MAG: AtpZ/AtpI family protein [Actinomycetota bacterium]|nr:AtpZ/AtpI family protein [Actinomycetota bacterium]
MSEAKPSLPARFARFLIGKPRRTEATSSQGPTGAPDAVANAIELVLTPVFLFGIGFLVDRWLGTLPIFSLVGVFFGAAGSILKLYYSVMNPSGGVIGADAARPANIVSRSEPMPGDAKQASSGLLAANLEIPEELRRLAATLDGEDSAGKGPEPGLPG